jgi:hypothetical protein
MALKASTVITCIVHCGGKERCRIAALVMIAQGGAEKRENFK